MVDNVARTYLHPRANNPVTPLPHTQFPRRLFSETDPWFLDTSARNKSTTTSMSVRRCSNCHLYLEGSPSQDLLHVGKFGPECTSAHHPQPCDYSSRSGLCSFYSDDESELTPAQLQARDKTRQQELDKMAAEMVDLKAKQGSMDNMALELAELKKLMMSIRPGPSPEGSLSHSATVSTENLQNNIQVQNLLNSNPTSAPNLGSQSTSSPSVTAPDLSHLGAASFTAQQFSLVEDITSHIQKNSLPPATLQSRGGYTGPLMADIRKDIEVDMVAKRVLDLLEMNIPQIKETFAQPPVQTSAASLAPNQGTYTTYTRPLQHHLGTTTTSSITRPLSSVTQITGSSQLTYPQPPVNIHHLPQIQQQQYPYYYPGAHPDHNVPVQNPLYYPSHTIAHPSAADIQGAGLGLSGVPASTAQAPAAFRPTVLSDDDPLDAAAIMQLCTVSNRKQLRPHEFAKMGRFSYASKITDKNITVPLYVFGYLQHVIALLKGVVPVQNDTEVIDRLINLMTIMEITANNSTLDDFKCPGWSIGLEYASRIFHDIEFGRVKWEDLSEGLQPHTFLYAKDTVDMQQGKNARGGGVQPRGRGRGRGGNGRGRGGSNSDRFEDTGDGNRVCQSYNGFWTGTGCAFEYSYNRKCGYEHFCSSCYKKTGRKEVHKAVYCTDPELVTSGGNSGNKPVTTSG